MRTSALLSILQTMLETAIVLRTQYMWSRAYKDVDGMREALEMSLAMDEDLIAILNDTQFEPLNLSGGRHPGTPEEIIEVMRIMKRTQSASIAQGLKTIPGDIPELEERRRDTTDRKMEAVGNYFRRMRRILKENWPYFWKESYQREFAKMLKLRAPKRKR